MKQYFTISIYMCYTEFNDVVKINLKELIFMAKVKNPKMAWGNWNLKSDFMVLEYKTDDESLFSIPIEHLSDSYGVLNIIYEVYRKEWCSAKVMKDLLRAIDDVLFPSVSICFNRENNKIDPKELVNEYVKNGPDKINRLYGLLNSKVE